MRLIFVQNLTNYKQPQSRQKNIQIKIKYL